MTLYIIHPNVYETIHIISLSFSLLLERGYFQILPCLRAESYYMVVYAGKKLSVTHNIGLELHY